MGMRKYYLVENEEEFLKVIKKAKRGSRIVWNDVAVVKK